MRPALDMHEPSCAVTSLRGSPRRRVERGTGQAFRCHGFILLPVALALAVVAVLVYALNRHSSVAVDVSVQSRDETRARYVAEAGLAHARWLTQNEACAGDLTLPATALGADSYTATVTAPGPVTSTPYSVTVSQDAWLKESSPDENHGSDVELSVKNAGGDGMRTVYRFDLSPIPLGSQVTSATGWFRVTGNDDSGAVEIHAVNTDWDEGAATWNTLADSFDIQVVDSIPAQSQSSIWVQANLTALVQHWVGGGAPNYGIMLIATSDGVESKYTAREWGTIGERPRLEVVVGNGIASPVTITATGTLDNGVTHRLTRRAVTAYQLPSQTSGPAGPGVSDTFAAGTGPDDNHGADDTLEVGDAGSASYALIDFEVPIAYGADIVSAELSLYLQSVGSSLAGSEIAVHRMLEPWTEDGATYNSSDGATGWTWPDNYDAANPVAAVGFGSPAPGWYRWNVTSLVQGWADDTYPDYGLVVAGAGGVSNARFASGDAADPALSPKLDVTYRCECGIVCIAPQGSGSILLTVADATSLPPQDAYKKRLFESWGYTVDVIDDDASAAEFDAAIAANDVVYISDSSVSATVGTKVRDAVIGVVSEEGALNDELGLATGYANPVLGDSIDVVDPAHYITAPFPSGALRIYEAPMEGLVATEPTAGHLQALLAWGGEPALAVVEFGGWLVGGTDTAAERRVQLPFGRSVESSFDWAYLNGNGRLMAHRAIEWAAGAASLPGPIAHWRLDDGGGSVAVDSVGGHDAALDETDWTSGRIAGGLEFDESDSVADAGSDSELDDTFAGGGTITAWIEPSGWGGGGYGRIADKADSDSGNRNGWAFSVRASNESLTFRHGYSGHIGAWHTPSGSIALDAWQHVAVVYDNGSEANDPQLYIDGVLQPLTETHVASGSPSSDAASDFAIGNYALDTSRHFEGVLDDVRVYDRSLFPGEVAALADGDCNGTFRDEFNARSYSGNDGSLSWTTDWLEVNESNGPTAGDEQVLDDESAYQLRIRDNNGGGEGVERTADLSGATSATLRFDYRREGLDNVDDYVTVEVSTNGGGSWTELDRFRGPGTDGSYQSVTYDISTHVAADTVVRFLSSPSLGSSDEVYFDNVEIQCSP